MHKPPLAPSAVLRIFSTFCIFLLKFRGIYIMMESKKYSYFVHNIYLGVYSCNRKIKCSKFAGSS